MLENPDVYQYLQTIKKKVRINVSVFFQITEPTETKEEKKR